MPSGWPPSRFTDHDPTPVHFDETGLVVAGRLQWVHVAGTSLVTYLVGHAKRGRQALAELGILPNRRRRAIHEGYLSYFQYSNTEYSLCNAHHLRSLSFIHERYRQAWADRLGQLAQFDRRYDEFIAQDLAQKAWFPLLSCFPFFSTRSTRLSSYL